MAIEFDIKMLRPFGTGALIERANASVRAFGISGVLNADQARHVLWGDGERDGVVSLDDVEVSLLCYKAGEEADLGDEGGFWLTISAAPSRTGEGVFLALVLAIAAAEEAVSTIIDDAGLLQHGRSLDPVDALSWLQRIVGTGDMESIGARLSYELGLPSDG